MMKIDLNQSTGQYMDIVLHKNEKLLDHVFYIILHLLQLYDSYYFMIIAYVPQTNLCFSMALLYYIADAL